MPFVKSGYVQSVVVQGRVYVGGGIAVMDTDKVIMEYNTSSAKWACLPSYQLDSFGMTVINNQLVLVGGRESFVGHSKALGVWGAKSRKWMHPYPEMPTSRSLCSVAVFKEWLIVAGGVSQGMRSISSVEVMNIDTKQWHTGQPTSTPWDSMKTAIVGDMCYFMGGYTNNIISDWTDSVYCVSLPALVSQAQSRVSRKNSHSAWKELRRPGVKYSVPLSISGSLLAVGGYDSASRDDITAIHLYQPDTGEWVKVGDLPTPRRKLTCAMITNREILIAGGDTKYHTICTLHLGNISS